VTVRGAVPDAEMVRVKETACVCTGLLESVTVKVRGVAFAAAVGVPVITPVPAFSDNPAGSVPAVRVHV
jgi:hypothetical protein